MTAESGDITRNAGFRDLLGLVAAGDPAAQDRLVAEYGSHILRAVRRLLNSATRTSYDSADFEQSVWKSFFGHVSVVERISTEGQLAAFLKRMASNKVIDAGRHAQVARTHSGDELLPVVTTDQRTKRTHATPSEIVIADECMEAMTAGEDARYAKVLKLKHSGATSQEIADELGVSERHIRRVLARLERKARPQLPADPV